MYGVDDTLDDAHWTNVQDPIKQMFLALTKAMRAQAAGIRDLDRKCNDFITKDNACALVMDNFDRACSKQDATQIIYKLDSKAGEKDLAVLSSKLDQTIDMLGKLSDKVHDQALSMSDINLRMDHIEKDLELLKNPNYDQLFGYIDRQVDNAVTDFTRKLELKADIRYVDTSLPERLENLYRNMNIKINEMQADIRKTATKEEFQELANTKADGLELRNLAADVNDRTTRHELHQAINNHIQPVTSALSSLEKAIQIQEGMNKTQHMTIIEKAEALERMLEDQIQYRLQNTVNSSPQAPVSAERVYAILEDTIRDRKLGEVTTLSVEQSLGSHTEGLLRHLGRTTEAIRLEIMTANRDEMAIAMGKIVNMSDYVAGLSKEIEEKQARTKKSVKDLSLNVAKALSKKLDVRDFKKVIKNQDGEVQRIASSHSSRQGGRGRRYSSIVSGSRHLLNQSQDDNFHGYSPRRRRDGGAGGGEGIDDEVADAAETEFDFLVNSMRQTGDDSSSGAITGGVQRSGGGGRDCDRDKDRSRHRIDSPSRGAGEGKCVTSTSSSGVDDVPRVPSRLRSTSALGTTSRDGKGSDVKLQMAVDALSRQYDRLADQLGLQQKQLNALRETQRALHSGGGGGGGVGSPRRHAPLSTSALSMNANENGTLSASHTASLAELERLDWRLAMGELSMNLRREIADKASREELYSAVRNEIALVDKQIATLQTSIDNAALAADLSKVGNELTALRHKVAGELSGARFLWTSGHLVNEGYVPWDVAAVNAAPAVIVWKKSTTSVLVRIPGLYKLCVCIFTSVPAILQIYINEEPLFSYQPDSVNSGNRAGPTAVTSQTSDKFFLRRLRHSAGEVSSLCIDEYVSLPPEAAISVRYYSAIPAQGFLSLRKM